MHEIDVRRMLYRTEIRRVLKEQPKSRVVDELVLLRGQVRVDVAVINDSLHGYEIKSEFDNLKRLAGQQEAYGKVFDRMTLVADERHVEHAIKMVPPCWGLTVVGTRDGVPFANEIWPARRNLELDRLALAQLLWREEALELLDYFDLATGVRSKTRKVLWQTLARNLKTEELRAFVCFKLRTRTGWRRKKRVS